MDVLLVQSILRRSANEQWPYPRIFDALKHAGVEYYVTDVDRQRVVYYGLKNFHEQRLVLGGETLEVAPVYNQEGVIQATARVQNKEITFLDFLKALAAAGINRYRVDMHDRTITYNHSPTEHYVESVPPYQPPEE